MGPVVAGSNPALPTSGEVAQSGLEHRHSVFPTVATPIYISRSGVEQSYFAYKVREVAGSNPAIVFGGVVEW